MKTGRKTTQEERISIAKECLENDCNYEEVAARESSFVMMEEFCILIEVVGSRIHSCGKIAWNDRLRPKHSNEYLQKDAHTNDPPRIQMRTCEI